MKMKTSVLALLTGMALSGCTPHQTSSSSPAVQPLAQAAQSDSIVKRQLAYGLYEMALTPGEMRCTSPVPKVLKMYRVAWSISWTPRP